MTTRLSLRLVVPILAVAGGATVLLMATAGVRPSATAAATTIPTATPVPVATAQQTPLRPVTPLRLADGSVPPPYQPDPQRLASAKATVEAGGPLSIPKSPAEWTPEQRAFAEKMRLGDPGSTQADLDRILAAKPTPSSDDDVRMGQFNATKGTKVRFGAKEVQLPPDAGIVGTVLGRPVLGPGPDGKLVRVGPGGKPIEGTPPDTSEVIVQRGESRAYVGETNHKVQRINGDARAFDWLVEALREG